MLTKETWKPVTVTETLPPVTETLPPVTYTTTDTTTVISTPYVRNIQRSIFFQ
jgi:hypothetical protein